MPRRSSELGRLVHNVRTFGIRAPIKADISSEYADNQQNPTSIENGDSLANEDLTAVIVANVDGVAELAVRETMRKSDQTSVD